jgi:hypothetical protein
MAQWRFNGDSKSLSPIRTAEHFRPLLVLDGVESVREIETGLKRSVVVKKTEKHRADAVP